jgi:[ribosomal protein S5]-alanine N-acetyltransferase
MSAQGAPVHLLGERLLFRKPEPRDADAIFSRYAGDAEVTRYISFPTHRSPDDARAFVEFSDQEWARWGCGPYLIHSRADDSLIGGTGLTFETPLRAMTGYILARDAWGRGYATEACRAMVDLAARLGVRRIYALCHADHRASARVLEKCGFAREAILRAHSVFPNFDPVEPQDVLSYARVIPDDRGPGTP